MPKNYEVHITEEEAGVLAFLAARYETAELLWQHAVLCEDVEPDRYGSYPHGPALISLPEHDAWEYLKALAEENGNSDQVLPACVGGSLAEKLLDLYMEIV